MKAVRFVPFVLVALIAGCGGGGGSSSTPSPKGRATLTILWPSRATRLIPLAANSIVVSVLQDGAVVGSQTVPRPTGDAPQSEVDFGNLPYGDLQVTVKAFPTADGSGVAQAVGASSLTVASGLPTPITISLASTISTLTLTPSRNSIQKDDTLQVTATAKDADGNVVLLSAGTGSESLTWQNSDASVATLSVDGLVASVLGIQRGSATISAVVKVDDVGNTITGTVPVTVAGGLGTVIVK